jgi:hypothetical protein
MGLAKEIVSEAKPKLATALATRRSARAAGGLVADLETILDALDDAIDAKQRDAATEGISKLAENHYRLGILCSAGQLIRRARALLEDYEAPIQVKDKTILEAAFDFIKPKRKRNLGKGV